LKKNEAEGFSNTGKKCFALLVNRGELMSGVCFIAIMFTQCPKTFYDVFKR